MNNGIKITSGSMTLPEAKSEVKLKSRGLYKKKMMIKNKSLKFDERKELKTCYYNHHKSRAKIKKEM